SAYPRDAYRLGPDALWRAGNRVGAGQVGPIIEQEAVNPLCGLLFFFSQSENSVAHSENRLTHCSRPISFAPGRNKPMDATILPGPGVKQARPSRARADGDRHSIQSADRALYLLETIAEAGGEATLTDLANRTGLNISTCHHLLATLIKRGFAAKVPGRRLYALGARILDLGHACLQVDLPRRAQPYLENINQATGETVHLAALQGDSVVTVAVREARHAVR